MQQSSARSEGHTSPSCEPLRVTQEAVDAYEKCIGFKGIGKVMVEHGVWVIVPKGEVAQACWNTGGCTGPHPAGPVIACRDSNRADSAAGNRGGAP